MVRNAPYLYHCERRNTMKKKLSLFLAIIMILGILPINAFAANNTTSLAQTSNKDYEDATLDGVAYKVYNVADLMDMTSSKKVNVLMTESRKSNSYIKQNTPTQSSNIEFFLDLVWQTYDRPIKNVIMPVYVGNPADPRSKKLGYFEVTTNANEDQYIKMVQTYTDTSPSIEQLVKSAFHVITIAIPKDMRYDFILASTKWDSKKKQDNKVIFRVEGAQSVMHGFGIKWYDTDDANREKIDAVWTGKVGQTLDAKLAKVDRDYSAYFANKIVDSRKENYDDGGEYTPYDYYYNGQKITTYADAENQGKYTDVNLAINGPVDAPTASLTVDGMRDGSKVLKHNTKYLYHSVGDYRTFHVLSMREALQVKFNTGKGFLNDADKKAKKDKQNIKVKVNENNTEVEKDAQEIGHSEKIKGNESGRTITFPDGSKLVTPVKPQGQKTENEFKGWNTDLEATTALTQEQLNALTFTDKVTTFYAVFGPKADYYINVKYVKETKEDQEIEDTYKLENQDYPATKSGKTGKSGEEISSEDLDTKNAPKFLGYEITKTVKTVPTPNVGEKAEYTLEGKYTVKFIYKKLADIIPEDEASDDVKKTYAKVTFTNGLTENIHGDLYLNTTKVEGGKVTYYVNPKAGKSVEDVRATAKVNVKVTDAAYEVEANKEWIDENKAKVDLANRKITKKEEITVNANYKMKGNASVTVEYVDEAGADISANLKEGQFNAGKDLVKSIEGTKDTTVTEQKVKDEIKAGLKEGTEPLFIGYMFKEINVKPEGTDAKYGAQNAKVKVVYTKLDDVIKGKDDNGEDTPDIPDSDSDKDKKEETIKKTYVKVKFLADDNQHTGTKARGTLTGDTIYFVNPKSTTTLGGHISSDKIEEPTVNAKDGFKVKDPKWNPDLTEAKKSTVTKDLTFVAQYEEKGQGKAAVEYHVGAEDITAKIAELKIKGQDYPKNNQLEGKVDTAIDITKIKQPELLGYKIVENNQITTEPATDAMYTEEGTAKVIFHYEKIDDIIGPVKPSDTKPAGYVTVTFKSDDDKHTTPRGQLYLGTEDTKLFTELVYYVNPKANTIDLDNNKLSGKDKEDKAINILVNAKPENKYEILKKQGGAYDWKLSDSNAIVEGKVTKDLTLTVQYDGLYSLKYEYKSAKAGKDLPAEIVQPISPTDPAKLSAIPDTLKVPDMKSLVVKDGDKVKGVWYFDKWERTVDDKKQEVTFTGYWMYFEPIPKDITVQVGETPKAKDGIENHKDAPKGTDYKFKDPIDTKTPGDKDATVIVTIPNEKEPQNPTVIEVPIVVHVTDLRCMTPAPEINPVYDSDEYITGRGIAGAVIEVRYRDYPILRTKVDTFGEWEVYTPYPLEDEQFVYARQIKEPCDPSVWVSEEIRYDYEYWRKDDKKEEPKKPVEIKKVWTPAELNARDHFSYIKGYGDNTFGPNRTITRAEVAMIFARLSINQSVSGAPQFKDVKAGDWYKTAVDIVARQGVVKGYEDGTFRPNQPITRREFAAIAARYAGNIDTWRTFRDVPSTDWAYTLINRVGGAGWITGYEDNTFRPNNNITRAEVVAIVNRMLNRKADKAYVDNNLMRSKHSFIDNQRSAWYFYDIHEAAVGHSFERQPNGVDEKWNRVNGQAFEIRER